MEISSQWDNGDPFRAYTWTTERYNDISKRDALGEREPTERQQDGGSDVAKGYKTCTARHGSSLRKGLLVGWTEIAPVEITPQPKNREDFRVIQVSRGIIIQFWIFLLFWSLNVFNTLESPGCLFRGVITQLWIFLLFWSLNTLNVEYIFNIYIYFFFIAKIEISSIRIWIPKQ